MKVGLGAAFGVLAMGTTSNAASLEAMLWKTRPVVLVAPSTADDRLKAQQALLRAKAATLRAYDVEIVTATDDSARRQWHVEKDAFATILIGKDGGEKARWSSPVDPAKIFAEIDTMPMRRQEVRKR